MILSEAPGNAHRRRVSNLEQVSGKSGGGGSGGKQGSPLHSSKMEYTTSYRDGYSSTPAGSRFKSTSQGSGAATPKRSDPGNPITGGSPSSSKGQANDRSNGSAPLSKTASMRSPDTQGLSSSGMFQMVRQASDRKMKSAIPDLPSNSRAHNRVSSYNSRGVAAALGGSLPLFGSTMRSRSIGHVPVEHEIQIGDLVIGYGSSSLQGMRDYQEDTVAFLQTHTSLAGAVYDGHGGGEVSKELERVLLQNIQKEINDATSRDQDPGGPSPQVVHNAIANAYTYTNEDIGHRLHAAKEAGSCAVTALVMRSNGNLHLFCANAGDCRAVLYTGPPGFKRAVRMSEDHKPQPHVCPAEIARVCDAGGCVLWGRVQGCLAVSRAFGDRTLQPYVIADPYVCSRPLNLDQDSFFFLASDGVTDLIDDNTGCTIVADQLARGCNAAQAAAALVNAAYQQGSSDNISAVVMRFKKR
mmetsp:Transcript_37253/g.82877  ORF Transcript_37253/g.82877 Transcript_37253/m.82877 type:complete len:468 (+) Transcript_37253:278-1681(+)